MGNWLPENSIFFAACGAIGKECSAAGGIAAKPDVNRIQKKYSGSETVESAETADGWFCRIFEIEKILEREFFEAGNLEG
jgi:hypothetical protein